MGYLATGLVISRFALFCLLLKFNALLVEVFLQPSIQKQ